MKTFFSSFLYNSCEFFCVWKPCPDDTELNRISRDVMNAILLIYMRLLICNPWFHQKSWFFVLLEDSSSVDRLHYIFFKKIIVFSLHWDWIKFFHSNVSTSLKIFCIQMRTFEFLGKLNFMAPNRSTKHVISAYELRKYQKTKAK